MKYYRRLAIVGLFTILVFGYNNCGKVQFSNAPVSNAAAGTGAPICTFGGAGGPTQGLVATSLQYIPLVADGSTYDVQYTLNQGNQALAQSQYSGSTGLLSGSSSNIIQNTVEEFFDASNPYVNSINNPLYLGAINFPNIYFSEGFTPEGGTPLMVNGQLLDQFFSFRAISNFIPTWKPGVYQIATITDDGSVLTLSKAATGGGNLVIKNDGTHSMVMGCTETTITVGGTPQTYPLQFDYFQGPPVTIGLIALYRPLPTDGGLDPLCGQIDGSHTSQYGNQGDGYFFQDSPKAQTVAEAPYKQLVAPIGQTQADSGGWTPIEASNYNLPAGYSNPCN
jgi:hypothetical protein